MLNNEQQDLNNKAVPFFARFLEGQFGEELSEEEMKIVHGGARVSVDSEIRLTLKYPSDSDEAVTLKYPSDGDDNTPLD